MKITHTQGGMPPLGGQEYGDVWVGANGAHIWSVKIEQCGHPCSHCRPRQVGYWMAVSDETAELHIDSFVG